MQKFNITKRDIGFFFFGLITMFAVFLVYDWEDFKRGYNAGVKAASIEKSE